MSAHVSVEALGACRQITVLGEGVFNPDVLQDFLAALDQVAADTEAETLILTGEHKFFVQGLDLSYLIELDDLSRRTFASQCMQAVKRLLQFPIPTVAAVNGHAFGLGAMLMLACDYRVMREDRGYICLPEVDLGMVLIPSMEALINGTLSGSLRRDMLLTGKRIGSEEACERGLVDCACALDQLLMMASEIAAPMVGKQRDVIAGLKTNMYHAIIDAIDEEARVGLG